MPFVEEAILTLFYASVPFVEYYLSMKTWVYLLAVYSVPLFCVSVLMPVTDSFDYSDLLYSLISGIVIPSTLFFFLKIAEAIWGHL